MLEFPLEKFFLLGQCYPIKAGDEVSEACVAAGSCSSLGYRESQREILGPLVFMSWEVGSSTASCFPRGSGSIPRGAMGPQSLLKIPEGRNSGAALVLVPSPKFQPQPCHSLLLPLCDLPFPSV